MLPSQLPTVPNHLLWHPKVTEVNSRSPLECTVASSYSCFLTFQCSDLNVSTVRDEEVLVYCTCGLAMHQDWNGWTCTHMRTQTKCSLNAHTMHTVVPFHPVRLSKATTTSTHAALLHWGFGTILKYSQYVPWFKLLVKFYIFCQQKKFKMVQMSLIRHMQLNHVLYHYLYSMFQ